ncbi:helix-turn-helix domain-containing protein [Cupriavidus sp. Agwp_2]|uniref:helix-turn-helix domain-containing protein n=1 Tax=Cupriavidus sp. Agwp_2 TaxID=2897324 RepID=UPI00345F3BB0
MNSYTWRAAIIRSDLGPTTRHVLLTLSCHINDAGEPTYPSTLLLSDECGLSERAVVTHLKLAASLGWLTVSKHGYAGQGWARNQYRPRTPDGFVPRPAPVRKGTEAGSVPSDEKLSTEALNDVQYVEGEGTEGRSVPSGEALNVTTEGTERGDKKALNDVQSNYPLELPKELPKVARAKRKAVDKAFEQLWAVYPRKVSKDAALKAYRKLDPDEALQAVLLAAVEKQAASQAWTKDGGTFVPHASTWLNGRRWTDEVPEESPEGETGGAQSAAEPWYRRWSGITEKGAQVFRAFKEGEDPLRYKVNVFKRAGEGKWRDELMNELQRTKNSLYADIHQYIYGHPPIGDAA